MLLANNWTTGPKGVSRKHFIVRFSEHKPSLNPQVIDYNNLQQVRYKDGEEHNFCVFLFHTLKKQIFDGGNQMKLRVNQQIYFGKRWMLKLNDALFSWPLLAQL